MVLQMALQMALQMVLQMVKQLGLHSEHLKVMVKGHLSGPL